jgi:hypothetical protein
MITLTTEQSEKIELLDKLLGAISVTQLREFTESEQIVAILKGTNHNPMIIQRLIQEHDSYANDLMMMKTDISVLKNDFKELMKALNTALFTVPYSQEFQNLKNKNNIY